MGLFDFFKKPTKQAQQPKIEETKQEPEEKISCPAQPIVKPAPKYDVTIPKRIGKFVLVYCYDKLSIMPAQNAQEMAQNMLISNDWELSAAKAESGKIELFYYGQEFATLQEKEDMVSDWIKRSDPMKIYLKNLGNSGNFATVAFYRDEQERLSKRETSVVKLTRCTNEDAQLSMIGLEEGDKLELEEDYEREDSVNVLVDGAEIGALPKKYSVKYI